MKNFYKLFQNMDVMPLMMAIQTQPELWNENKLRTTHELSPHTEAEDIWLRFNDLELYEGNELAMADEHESINYRAFYALPQARTLIFALMAAVQGERLGRCLITKLAPGKKIEAHEDGGSHAEYYERYHIVLQGLPGSNFTCGEEQVYMKTGDVWWFDNSVEHEIINNSSDDRIHLIVDIKVSK